MNIALSNILRNVVKFPNYSKFFEKYDPFGQFKNLIEYLTNEKFIDKIKDSKINISDVLDSAGEILDTFDMFKKLLEKEGLDIEELEDDNEGHEGGNDYGSESVQEYHVNTLGQ